LVTLAPSGSATKWNDYRLTTGDMPDTFTIPAGASSATFVVYAPDDGIANDPKSATLTDQASANYNVGTPRSVDLTIQEAGSSTGDTTPPTVSLTAPANNATASGSSVTVSA